MSKLPSVLFAVVTAVTLIGQSAYAQAPSRPAVNGEIAGMSRERWARIAPVMQEQVDKGTFPGAVTFVARRGTVVH